MLAEIRFLDTLKEYDKDNMNPQIIEKIRKTYINNPEFNPHLIKNVSSACQGLCKWVIAISSYDEISKIVRPKREKLEEARAMLDNQLVNLAEKGKELKRVTAKLQLLYDKLETKQIEQRELEAKIETFKIKLDRAEKLIDGLSDEKIR